MSTKFFVYAESGWNQLDIDSGRVSGWRERARFVYFRRGRLQQARTSAVLRGLRSLAAGQRGSVRDSHRLYQKSAESPAEVVRRIKPSREHRCCCSRRHRCESRDKNIDSDQNKQHIVITVDSSQAQSTQATNDNPQTNVDSNNITVVQQKNQENNINIKIVSPVKQKQSYTLNKKNASPDTRKENETDSDSVETYAPVRPRRKLFNPTKQLEKITRLKSEFDPASDTTYTSESSINSDGFKKRRKKIPVTRSRVQIQTPAVESSDDSSDTGGRKELLIEDDDVQLYRGYLKKHDPAVDIERFDRDDDYKTYMFFRINPIVMVERSEKIDEMVRDQRESSQSSQDDLSLKDFAYMLGLKDMNERTKITPRYRTRQSRENDQAESSHNRPRAESSHERTRAESSRKPKPSIIISSDSETDKENFVQKPRLLRSSLNNNVNTESVRRSLRSSPKHSNPKTANSDVKTFVDKVIHKNDNKVTTTAVIEAEPRRHSLRGVKESNTIDKEVDSARKRMEERVVEIQKENDKKRDKEQKSKKKEREKLKQNLHKEVKTQRKRNVGGGREFSSLEDHAIVAWLGLGARISKVNGNQIWRELQAEYENLTGHFRSWHSLRNRYLRYILPSLHNMALPMAQVERMRAAASTGELKARKAASRRNSMLYVPPTRSAFSRRQHKPLHYH